MKITCAKCRTCAFFLDRKLAEKKKMCCSEAGSKPDDDACESYLFNYKDVDIHNPVIKSILKFVRNTDTKDLELLGNIVNQEQITRKQGLIIGSMFYIKPISSINNYIKVVLLDANDKIAHIQGVTNKKFYGEVSLNNLISLDSIDSSLVEKKDAYDEFMRNKNNKDASYQPTFKRGRKPKKEESDKDSLENQANEFLKENDTESEYSFKESNENDVNKDNDNPEENYPFDGTFNEENLEDNYNEEE